jgi:hypothetical protein
MGLDKVLYNFARRGVMPTLQGGVGGGPISVDSSGRVIRTGVGREFFVSNNFGSDSNDGSSWDKAFLTLAAAISANNADISADKYGWDSRNRIYLTSGPTTEDLVAFPNKCDVIGVGSYDANDKPGITGNHVPVNTQNWGTRFINIWFKAPADASPIVTLASTSSGIQFIDCIFDATATTTTGILATASPFLKVIGCDFRGAFTTSYITFGTGEAGGTRIIGNTMTDGADNGIVLGANTTASWMGIIKDNLIQCADIAIDTQATSVFIVVKNTFISGEAAGASSYVIDLSFASENYLTANDVSVCIPDISTN